MTKKLGRLAFAGISASLVLVLSGCSPELERGFLPDAS
ncbi:MAG: cytochrome C oxidase subunit II, partial [Candidatus Aquiluna sp.]|nr:cytochrome C oxidase subunit II [Aquiluna sp.]